jgi:hypothetical protein
LVPLRVVLPLKHSTSFAIEKRIYADCYSPYSKLPRASLLLKATNLTCYVVLSTVRYNRPLKIYYCPPKPGDKWPPQHIGRNMDNPNINPESSSTHSMKK